MCVNLLIMYTMQSEVTLFFFKLVPNVAVFLSSKSKPCNSSEWEVNALQNVLACTLTKQKKPEN